MATRIKVPARDPGVRVELGEHLGSISDFKLKPITMEIEEELNELQRVSRQVEENPDSKPFDLAEAEVKQLDVILEPVARPAGDGPREELLPSEIMLGDLGEETGDPPRPRREGYVTGAVTRSQIQATVIRVIEAARPT
jgi:hypothetical protein